MPLRLERKRRQKLLLERHEVNPDSRGNDCLTPLSHADKGWGEGVLKFLLEREDIDSDSGDYLGRTPHSWTPCAGREESASLLQGLGEPDPESPDLGSTPLSHGAELGNEWLEGLFLRLVKVDPESRDEYSRTQLCYAAGAWSMWVVKLLLEWYEVNLESRDNSGRRPFFFGLLKAGMRR